MKNKKVLLIARFSVQNFNVSVESLKSYIVQPEEEIIGVMKKGHHVEQKWKLDQSFNAKLKDTMTDGAWCI